MQLKTNEVTTKYTWKFWCLVISEITLIVIFILLFGLSIKALVQDIQINTYKYKAKWTVTVAEFYGKTWVSNESDSGSSSKFSYMHYVICFDEEIGGHDRYEYRASNMIGTERYYGDRYLVAEYQADINEATQHLTMAINALVEADDAEEEKETNPVSTAIVLVVLIFLLRKKIYLWLTKLEKKMNSFIIYQ